MGKSTSFINAVLALLTGTAGSQLIVIAASPLIARLFSPAEFGVFAFFMSIVTILASFSTARFELAIVLPESDEEAISLAVLSAGLALIIAVFALVFFSIASAVSVSWLDNLKPSLIIYFIAFAVVLNAFYQIAYQYSLRKKRFGEISRIGIARSLLNVIIQLSSGVGKLGSLGLVISQIISTAVGFSLFKFVFKELKTLRQVSWNSIKSVAVRYQNFPKFNLPGNVIVTAVPSLMQFFIIGMYSPEFLGFFAMTQRLLAFPTRVIGTSIQKVFIQQAAEGINNKENINQLYNRIFGLLFCISVVLFAILFLFVNDLVVVFLGKQWSEVGTYSQVLIPLFFIQFLSIPLGAMFNLTGKQKQGLGWQLSRLALLLLCFAVTKVYSLSILYFLGLFALSQSIAYLFLIFLSKHIALGLGKAAA